MKDYHLLASVMMTVDLMPDAWASLFERPVLQAKDRNPRIYSPPLYCALCSDSSPHDDLFADEDDGDTSGR